MKERKVILLKYTECIEMKIDSGLPELKGKKRTI